VNAALLRSLAGALAIVSALATAAAAAAPAGASAPACSYCRMILSDPAYGGTLRTTNGRLLRYDSIECMAAAVLTDSVPPRRIRAASVVEHEAAHRTLDAARAVYLYSPALQSPMGLGLSAHADSAQALRTRGLGEGLLLGWAQVLERVDLVWFQGRLDAAGHAKLPATKH